MPNQVSYVDNSTMLAHYAMLQRIRDFATANGWTQLRYDTTAANRELILRGPGLSGTEEIYVGFRTYQNADSDYYNLVAATFTGYLSGNTFDNQPGAILSGVPAHNNRIDYWLTLNGQRIALAMKVGTPVFESLYVGKFLPYAIPSQYPYPVVCAGMLNGTPTTRFSETTHSIPYKGSRANFRMRDPAGAWIQPVVAAWQNDVLNALRDTGGVYPLIPVELYVAGSNVYGELDGIYKISGFNNAVENTLLIGGQNYVVIQDTYRTGFNDYYAMRLDA